MSMELTIDISSVANDSRSFYRSLDRFVKLLEKYYSVDQHVSSDGHVKFIKLFCKQGYAKPFFC